MMKMLEGMLTDDGPFLGGSKPNIADCCMVACLVNIWENANNPYSVKFKPVLAQYPKLTAYNLKLREAFKSRIESPARKQLAF